MYHIIIIIHKQMLVRNVRGRIQNASMEFVNAKNISIFLNLQALKKKDARV